jgi:hypothetical protein
VFPFVPIDLPQDTFDADLAKDSVLPRPAEERLAFVTGR